jgi:hypothetical protein
VSRTPSCGSRSRRRPSSCGRWWPARRRRLRGPGDPARGRGPHHAAGRGPGGLRPTGPADPDLGPVGDLPRRLVDAGARARRPAAGRALAGCRRRIPPARGAGPDGGAGAGLVCPARGPGRPLERGAAAGRSGRVRPADPGHRPPRRRPGRPDGRRARPRAAAHWPWTPDLLGGPTQRSGRKHDPLAFVDCG